MAKYDPAEGYKYVAYACWTNQEGFSFRGKPDGAKSFPVALLWGDAIIVVETPDEKNPYRAFSEIEKIAAGWLHIDGVCMRKGINHG